MVKYSPTARGKTRQTVFFHPNMITQQFVSYKDAIAGWFFKKVCGFPIQAVWKKEVLHFPQWAHARKHPK